MLPPPTSPEGETAASKQHWFACTEGTVITVKVPGQMKINRHAKEDKPNQILYLH